MNKPQLAFAWLGDKATLNALWAAMKATVIGAAPPKELMPNPSIYAAESESWNYRFSCCFVLADLLHMRVHARRHSGVIWCRTSKKAPTQEELEMLCYAMGCRLPLAVIVSDLTEDTEPADLFENETRGLVASMGGDADEALFVYASSSPQETLRRAYQRLDDSLVAPPLIPPPEAFIKTSEVELLLLCQHAPKSAEAPQKIEVILQQEIIRHGWRDVGRTGRNIEEQTTAILHPEQRATSSSVALLRQYQVQDVHVLGVRVMFDSVVAFPSQKELNATLYAAGQALVCRCLLLS